MAVSPPQWPTIERRGDLDGGGAIDGLPGSLQGQVALAPAHPNPFNAETVLFVELPRATAVRLEIHNTVGQRVRTLLDHTMTSGRPSSGMVAAMTDSCFAQGCISFRCTRGVNVSYDGSCFCDEGCGRLTGATATGYILGPFEPEPVDLARRKLSLRLDGSSPI